MWFSGQPDEGGDGGFDSGGEVGGGCEIHGRKFGVDGAVVKFGGEGVPGRERRGRLHKGMRMPMDSWAAVLYAKTIREAKEGQRR